MTTFRLILMKMIAIHRVTRNCVHSAASTQVSFQTLYLTDFKLYECTLNLFLEPYQAAIHPMLV